MTTMSVATIVFLVAPLFAIAVISFSASRYLEFPPEHFSLRWYETAFHDSSWLSALATSIAVAVPAAIIATALGTLAAFGFVRSQFLGKSALLAVSLSPMVTPGIVFAVGSYFLFARLGLLETRTALVLAHAALALPVTLISVAAALGAVDPRLEQSARTLGARPADAAWRVTMPIIRPAVFSGAVLAFVTSFDEPVVSLFVAGTRTVTLPKRMWDGIQYEIDPTAAAVSTMLIVVAIGAVAATVWFRRSRS